jgi:hypothetical protein
MREKSALLYGIVIAHGLDDSAYKEAIQDLMNSVKSKSPLEAQHGCLLALAHALERRISLMKRENTFPSYAVYKKGVEAIGKVCNRGVEV